ncbi:MAG: hypothetical protein VB020_04470 [Methanocorpusculum sp.]|nr:hypothetical protein [Methanocorpusculum sp.]
MKKLTVFLGLLAVLVVACAGCISPDVPAVNNTGTADPIVGTWQSTESYTVNGNEFYIIYEIKDDNTGYAMRSVDGLSEEKKVAIFWGNDKGTYVFAYSTDTQTVYPHTLSADAKILTDQDGGTYTRI